MVRKLDQIIVVDVEATCWEGAPPKGEVSEIIEIGVCPLDVASGQRLGCRSVLVRPERSRVSPFCTRLTTLTQEQVDAGMPFAAACALLSREYGSKERLWASYGDYDRRQFERQCQGRGIAYPFGPGHLNVKSLFAVVQALPREVGMAEALAALGLPLEGTHHRAGDIPGVIARLLAGIHLQSRGGAGTARARSA
ncbi:MAG: exonuclease domain-containing protein [Chloroflexota bacterium]|nr:exonuclease domain-containing protein [Chloroflexota bacterium]